MRDNNTILLVFQPGFAARSIVFVCVRACVCVCTHNFSSGILKWLCNPCVLDGYFDPHQMLCYCESCHKQRGDDLYHKRGEPPRDYALPYGWCRYVLRFVFCMVVGNGGGIGRVRRR